MARNHYISGEWNVICDVCSEKIKAHEARKRWDGFIVCPDDWEERHPQDFVRARQDKITVPFMRPRPPDVFVDDGNRSVVDVLNPMESISKEFGTIFDDMVSMDDSGQDYIDTTYFLEDYIGSISIVILSNKLLQDTTTTLEAGLVIKNPYIDATYFAELYVADEYAQF